MAEQLYGGKTWEQILNETVQSIDKLSATKGDEYKASDDDQLANFRRRAERYGLPMEMTWAIYAGKHWDAIETYCRDILEKRIRQRSEPLEGRVDDLIVYLILFKAMLAERNVGEQAVEHLTLCSVCSMMRPWDGCTRSYCQRAAKVMQS